MLKGRYFISEAKTCKYFVLLAYLDSDVKRQKDVISTGYKRKIEHMIRKGGYHFSNG